MPFPTPDPLFLLSRLALPAHAVDMVLDTDTYNEVDDQFALMYALFSPDRVHLQAVYAAPFHNARSTGPADGMEKSYAEILRLLDLAGVSADGFVFRGADQYLPDAQTPVSSPAVRDLIRRAMARPASDPLYVCAIGCITNIASAILLEPRLLSHIVVVWLAGHALSWPHTREFNLVQDPAASRLILDSGVPLILVPCLGVASHLTASAYEIQACLGGKNRVCDALADLFCAYTDNPLGWAKEIWDVAAVSTVMHPEWVESEITSSPLLPDAAHWARDPNRHPIRVVRRLNRTAIFRDMFTVLSRAEC